MATTVTKFLRSRPPAVVRQALFVLIQDAVLQIADRLAREGRYADAIVHYQEIYEIAQTARAVATCELQIAKMTYLIGDVDAAERRLREWVFKNDTADLATNYQTSARYYLGEIAVREGPDGAGAGTFRRGAGNRRTPPPGGSPSRVALHFRDELASAAHKRGRRQSWGLFRTAQRKCPSQCRLGESVPTPVAHHPMRRSCTVSCRRRWP